MAIFVLLVLMLVCIVTAVVSVFAGVVVVVVVCLGEIRCCMTMVRLTGTGTVTARQRTCLLRIVFLLPIWVREGAEQLS